MLKVVAAFSFLTAAITPLTPHDRISVIPRGFDFPLVGAALPAGRGSAAIGYKMFADKCVSCHSPSASTRGITSKIGLTMTGCWRYPKPLFYFVKMTMPRNAPGSLTDSEVYAIIAFLLWDADVVNMGEIMTEQTLPRVTMPNRRGFISSDCQALSHYQ